MTTDLLNLQPGRKLDAMVAMCLGWKWYHWKNEPSKGRWLSGGMLDPESSIHRIILEERTESSPDIPLKAGSRGMYDGSWDQTVSIYHWSTNPGAAFEAAEQAGVFGDERVMGYFEQGTGEFLWEIGDGNTTDLLATGDTSAHVLCLGILALQDRDTLEEYASWLEGVE